MCMYTHMHTHLYLVPLYEFNSWGTFSISLTSLGMFADFN
jgi:hypothetical protein